MIDHLSERCNHLSPSLLGLQQRRWRSRTKRRGVVDVLLWHTQRCFISPGDIVEMVAALILLWAFDDAHGPGLPTPIVLSHFVKHLLPGVCPELDAYVAQSEILRRLWERRVSGI